MNSEQDWVLWFENYKNFIVDYAKLAAELDFPILCIGTELEKTVHRRTEWLEIISSIREVYEGKLIYAANFTEFEQVTFWDELDYIGIQAYFPISEGQEPDLNQLKKRLEKNHSLRLKSWLGTISCPLFLLKLAIAILPMQLLSHGFGPMKERNLRCPKKYRRVAIRHFLKPLGRSLGWQECIFGSGIRKEKGVTRIFHHKV